MSYSSAHETSNLRTYAFKEGAQSSGGRVALQRCLRPQALPDPSGQFKGRACASDSRKSRVRLTDGAQRHPRLQRAWPCCLDARLLASQGGPRRLRRGRGRVPEADAPPPAPSEFGKEGAFWTLAMAAEVSFEEGISERRVSGETVRATLARLGVRWQRAKRWMESPDPEYARKKGIEIG